MIYCTSSGRYISEDAIKAYLEPKQVDCYHISHGHVAYKVGNSFCCIDLDLLLNKQPRIRHRRVDRYKEPSSEQLDLPVVIDFLRSLLDALQKEVPK